MSLFFRLLALFYPLIVAAKYLFEKKPHKGTNHEKDAEI